MSIDDFYLSGEGPFYTDYLYKVQEDYPSAGIENSFNNLSAREIENLQHLYNYREDIIKQFNLTYKYHELGSETEDKWQYTIDKVFAQNMRAFNRYLQLYDDNDIDRLGKIFTENGWTHSEATQNAESNGQSASKNIFKDTPITPLMEQADYATNITDDSNTSKNTNESANEANASYEVTKKDRDKQNIELVKKNMDVWFDIITEFVYKFRECFMDELTRV